MGCACAIAALTDTGTHSSVGVRRSVIGIVLKVLQFKANRVAEAVSELDLVEKFSSVGAGGEQQHFAHISSEPQIWLNPADYIWGNIRQFMHL